MFPDMMNQNLDDRVPSLKSLLAFEVTARSGRFSLAAKELNVTQPAVSRLVANLEAHLEVGLLSRISAIVKNFAAAGRHLLSSNRAGDH